MSDMENSRFKKILSRVQNSQVKDTLDKHSILGSGSEQRALTEEEIANSHEDWEEQENDIAKIEVLPSEFPEISSIDGEERPIVEKEEEDNDLDPQVFDDDLYDEDERNDNLEEHVSNDYEEEAGLSELEEEKAKRDCANKLVETYCRKVSEKLSSGEHGAIVRYIMDDHSKIAKVSAFLAGYRAHTFDWARNMEESVTKIDKLQVTTGNIVKEVERLRDTFTLDNYNLLNKLQIHLDELKSMAPERKEPSNVPLSAKPPLKKSPEKEKIKPARIVVPETPPPVLDVIDVDNDNAAVENQVVLESINNKLAKVSLAPSKRGLIADLPSLIALNDSLKLGMLNEVLEKTNFDKLNETLALKGFKTIDDLDGIKPSDKKKKTEIMLSIMRSN